MILKPTSIEVKFDSFTFYDKEPHAIEAELLGIAPTRTRLAYIERGDGGFSILNDIPALQAAVVYVGVKVLDFITDKSLEYIYSVVRKSLKSQAEVNPKEYGENQLILIIDLDDVKIIVAVHPVAGEGMASFIQEKVKS